MTEPFLQIFGEGKSGRESSFDRATRGTASQGDISSIPLTQGALVTASFAIGGTTAVEHGLGRDPQGYIVVDKDDFGDFRTDAEMQPPSRSPQTPRLR